MVPTNTRQTKSTKNQHGHSISSESEDDKPGDNLNPDPSGLSEAQLGMVSILVKSAVEAAVAQVLPRREHSPTMHLGRRRRDLSPSLTGFRGERSFVNKQEKRVRKKVRS